MRFKDIIWLSICIMAITCCSSPAFAAANLGNIDFKAIDEYVRREMKTGKIPGLALGIVYGNDTIYLKGYGTANNKNEAVSPRTPFLVGSVGKTFTALAIRQLEKTRRIDIDAPVQKYIPWFRAEITSRHLLDQTSGFSNTSGGEPYLYNSKYTLEQLVGKLGKVKLNRPVGKSYEYSNINYLVLGLLIEKVSGLSYENYIRQNVFNPIDMNHSYTSEEEVINDGMASGYRVVFGFTAQTRFPYPKGHVASGYQFSTAEDMSKYLTCYLNNGYFRGKSIIPDNRLPYLHEPYGGFNPENHYYNEYWDITKGYSKSYNSFYGFVGASPNYNSVMLISQETGYGIAVLANSRNEYFIPAITSQTIGNGITDIILGKGMPKQFETKVNNRIFTLPVIALGILLIRLSWFKRFKRNVKIDRNRLVFSFLSIGILDIALPVLLLVGLPIYYDNTWAFFLGANPEFCYVILISLVLLIITGVSKAVLLLLNLGLGSSDSKVGDPY